jgi:hypothetical protein
MSTVLINKIIMEDRIFEKWDEFLEERVSAMKSATIEDYVEEVDFILDTLRKEARALLEKNDEGHLRTLRHGLRGVLRKLRDQKPFSF